ncbi:MAG: DUF695 domain-containing protein [Chitinophagaceae bacterium]
MKIHKLTLLPGLLFSLLANAQEDNWDVYMSQQDKGLASTMINLSLKAEAPVKKMPFLLITGVKFKDCTEDGMPSKKEFDNLYKVEDSIENIITENIQAKHAGTYTYACERQEYYYVSDTAGIRKKLQAMYKKNFPGYTGYVNIRKDQSWSGYLDFLYPSEEVLEFMKNQKVLLNLTQAGDKLEKERKVDHFIYFTSEKDQDCFITYATAQNFKVEGKDKVTGTRPFKLQISRTDKVDAVSITPLTLELRKQASRCNGDYDGWETFVIK